VDWAEGNDCSNVGLKDKEGRIPSGNLTYGKSPFFMGKFTINGDFP
jgi:hypothetical protein